jgi:uncharacterized protein (DUF433 family)
MTGLGCPKLRSSRYGALDIRAVYDYNSDNNYDSADMKTGPSMVISMRLPLSSGKRLKRMASRHGWTPSDASARLVEEGLRRSELAFIDFRDSAAGRQACIQGSSLAVWEIMLLARDYENDAAAVAKHLRWPGAKVMAAFNYAKAFPEEIKEAIADHDAMDFSTLSHLLPEAQEFVADKSRKKH